MHRGPVDLVEPDGLRAAQVRLLTEHDLLDAPDDAELDAVARLATAVSGYPVAMVNALQASQTCQLAHVGIDRVTMECDESLCHRASLVGGVVVSGDCATDPLFADLAWVDGRKGRVRRYAMAPLVVEGTTIGTVCVLDEEPGDPLPDDAQRQLADLAAVTAALVQRRREQRRSAAAHAEASRAHAELQRVRAFERTLLDALPVGVIALDTSRGTVLANGRARAWHGQRDDADLRAPGTESFAGDLYEADGTTPLPRERIPLTRALTEGVVSGVEVVVRCEGQPPRTVEATGTRVLDPVTGDPLGAVVALLDVTAQRALERRLRVAATHDVLTGLPDRGLLLERLDTALAGAAEPVAVLFCDLDDFKAVNDVHGHAAADAVLREVAARLSATLREGDTAARLGGDEFALVCPGVLSEAQAAVLVERLTAAVAAPVVVDGVPHQVGVSVGAVLSRPGSTADSLLTCADAAMYEAKSARRSARRGSSEIPFTRRADVATVGARRRR